MGINKSIQIFSNRIFKLGLLASATWIYFIQLIIRDNTKMYEILMLPVWIGWAAWLIYKHKFEKKLLNKFI
jgi:hypothetical protein